MVKIKKLGYLLGGAMMALSTLGGCQDDCIKWGSSLGKIHQPENQYNMNSDNKEIILGRASVSDSDSASHVTYCCWPEFNPEANMKNVNFLGESLYPSGLETEITVRYHDPEQINGFGYKSAKGKGMACVSVWPQDGINVKDVHLGSCSFYVSETPKVDAPVLFPGEKDEWKGGYKAASINFTIEPECLLKESEKSHRRCSQVTPYGECTEWRWE